MIAFDTSDVTVTQGTQSVSVNGSTNTIRITEQGDPYFLDLVPGKGLRFEIPEGGITFDVEEAGTKIFMYASVSLYNASDTQLGTTALLPCVPSAGITFDNAGTGIEIAEYMGQTNNASFGVVSGNTGGFDVDDMSYLEIQIKAYTTGGAVGVTLEDMKIKFRMQ